MNSGCPQNQSNTEKKPVNTSKVLDKIVSELPSNNPEKVNDTKDNRMLINNINQKYIIPLTIVS